MALYFAIRAMRKHLAKLIERLQSQPDLQRLVGEAASKTIQDWDWNRNAAAIWELLKNAKARSLSRN